MSPYTSEVRLEILFGIQRKVIHKGWLCYVIFKARNLISHSHSRLLQNKNKTLLKSHLTSFINAKM